MALGICHATLGNGTGAHRMIRQAHTYLAGAVSGTALIAIAIAVFVMLVSLQAARDWPFAGLVGSGDDASTPETAPAVPAAARAAGAAAGATAAAGKRAGSGPGQATSG